MKFISDRPFNRFCQGAVIRCGRYNQYAHHKETGCASLGEVKAQPAGLIQKDVHSHGSYYNIPPQSIRSAAAL